MTASNDEGKAGPSAPSADRVWSEFMAALDALAPEVRAAFLLHEIFEASYDDIARLIGLPAGTCRHHIEQARAHAIDHMRRLGKQEKAPPR